MLDVKMNASLSPVTPINIQHESSSYMGVWEQDPVSQHSHNNQHQNPHKLSEMMDMLVESSGLTLGNGTSSPTTTVTVHHQSRHPSSECHFPSSQQYLNSLPGLGDPYAAECQIMDSFNCPSSDAHFHKLPETSSSFSDNYDFIPDFNPQSHNPHSTPNHNHSPSIINGILHHSGGQCSPGCICSSAVPSFAHHMALNGDSGLGVLGGHHSSHQDFGWEDLNCDPGDYVFLTKGDSPTTSDSISYTEIDSELESSKSSGGSNSVLNDICQVSPPKRKVGRPPKKDKKMKRNEKKTGRLWEFIRDLLKNPEYCPSLVRWENPEEGHFRFVNSEKVAQLWGQIKGNPRMTYEKLSRAMRYYYKSHVFEPVLGRRLVYKFGYNATNWKPVNPNFMSLQKLYSN